MFTGRCRSAYRAGESIAYIANFSFPFLVPAWVGCFSYELVYVYFVWFDIMNTIGHANFEVIPRALQRGPLKYFVYTGASRLVFISPRFAIV